MGWMGRRTGVNLGDESWMFGGLEFDDFCDDKELVGFCNWMMAHEIGW